jgi:hypothetical protein
MNGFELAKEIRKIDDKVNICFLIAGEIPSKLRCIIMWTRRRISGQVYQIAN